MDGNDTATMLVSSMMRKGAPAQQSNMRSFRPETRTVEDGDIASVCGCLVYLTEAIFAISEHETIHSAVPRLARSSSAMCINDKRSCRRADDRQGLSKATIRK